MIGIGFHTDAFNQILRVAEPYEVTINIEPHGYYTTKPEFMAEMLAFADSPYLSMNFDTGNTFIAGQDPVSFAEQFCSRINHVHIKDVSQSLAAVSRGELTGIAVSHCAVGDGVNSENIRRCLGLLAGTGYDGVLSIECEGQGGPMIERSLAWVRNTLTEIASHVGGSS
jgi:sugar phosphate isomerase/epimerase